MSKKYRIPVSWQMYGHVEVTADNLEDAIAKVKLESDETPLPEGSYVETSFEVDHDAIDEES